MHDKRVLEEFHFNTRFLYLLSIIAVQLLDVTDCCPIYMCTMNLTVAGLNPSSYELTTGSAK